MFLPVSLTLLDNLVSAIPSAMGKASFLTYSNTDQDGVRVLEFLQYTKFYRIF